MKNQIAFVFLFLAGCSSQVSLGSEDEHVASTMPDGSRDALSTDALHTVDVSPDAPHYDFCVGKACATPCTVCDPHDTTCAEPPGSKQCNAHQQCVATPVCP
jgi:hypothetical protein